MEEVNFSLLNVLSILSLFAAWMFIFQITLLKRRRLANRLFSYYLFNITVIVAFFLFLDLGKIGVAMVILPACNAAVLLIGPLLWSYVKSLVREGEKLRYWPHLLLPIIIGSISLILVILTQSMPGSELGANARRILLYLTIGSLTGLFVLQNMFYIYKSIVEYNRHTKRVKEVFSYSEKVDLSWFKLLLIGYSMFIVGLVVANLVDDSISDLVFNLVLLLYVVFAGYHGLSQDPIYSEVPQLQPIEKSEIEVSNPVFDEIDQRLVTKMKEDKPYLDRSLTIHVLANALETNSKYLSQLINNKYKKSFVVFINEFRIEEAKQMLMDQKNQHLTIEGIGYEAGFKSKSTFNTTFKKYTGVTPTTYVKNNQA